MLLSPLTPRNRRPALYVFKTGDLVYMRWPSATGGRRLLGIVIDSRTPNIFDGNDDECDEPTVVPPGDPCKEFLVQFGDTPLWIRGWAIVPVTDRVYWKENFLNPDPDEDETE